MKAIDKATKNFKEQIQNVELVMFRSVQQGEDFDTVVQDNTTKNLILFKQVMPDDEVSDDQILSFVSKVKWDKMMNSNLIKEKYIEFLNKESKK